jgi:hypothetical protein
MNEWYVLLTPLAVLAVLAIFRFVGCTFSSSGGGPIEMPPDTEVGPPYGDIILGEAGLVSYWKLQDERAAEPAVPTAPNTPETGGPATDEKANNNPGTYKTVLVQQGGEFPDSPDAPGTLTLQAPGLLKPDGPNTSVSLDGGYVEVPFTPTLLLPSFTIEAMVRPEWSDTEIGLYRTVIAFNQFPGAFGFALYAGPEDPAAPGPAVWQIWLGDGTNFRQIPFNLDPKPVVDFTKTNYLAVTYDGATQLLNLYMYVENMDLDNNPFNSVHNASTAYQPTTDSTINFLIGMSLTPPGSTVPLAYPFKGRIQEVAVYDRALPIERIMHHTVSGLNL